MDSISIFILHSSLYADYSYLLELAFSPAPLYLSIMIVTEIDGLTLNESELAVDTFISGVSNLLC